MDGVVVLREGEKDQLVDLELAKVLQNFGVCQVQLTSEGQLRTSNFSKVGFIRHGDSLIRIEPKISIRKVLQLISPTLEDVQILSEQVEISASDDWTHALTEFFISASNVALALGPLHGYRGVSEAANLVKGRIDFSRQLKRNPGRPIPIEIDFDEFSPDIPENRIILTALQVLLTRFPLDVGQRNRLFELQYVLAAVTPIEHHKRIPTVTLTSLNNHYGPALRIAELILGFQGLDADVGETSASSFLLDMERIFEKYLENRFSILSEEGSQIFRAQGSGESLDRGGLVGIRPDYLWFEGGKATGVADAKYKVFSTKASVPNDDVYQMVTYCTRYGLHKGYLIYASSPNFSIDVEGSAITIEVRAVDLSLDLPEIEEQIAALLDEVLCKTVASRIG